MQHLLTDFPSEVIENIIFYLPQQSLINLSLTNYQFYQPCLKKLYRKISIQSNSILRPKGHSEINNRYRGDFVDSNETILYGFASASISAEHHQKLMVARLQALKLSIRVNPQLVEYMSQILIDQDQFEFNSEVLNAIKQLILTISKIDNNIEKIYIGSYPLRKKLGYQHWITAFPHLKSLIIDNKDQFQNLTGNENELIVTFRDHEHEDVSFDNEFDFKKLLKIRSLLVINNDKLYLKVMKYLNLAFLESPATLNLDTFTLLHTHEMKYSPYGFIPLDTITNLQLNLGCNESISCKQDCIEELLHHLVVSHKIKTLSIIQNSKAEINNHDYNEKWDILVLNFIKSIIDEPNNLQTLSIRHNIVKDGIIGDGYEGNYLRRLELYGHFLPNFLLKLTTKINVFLPNLVGSFSVYEQAMNNLMWNGCKCDHCLKYLTALDDFLIYHKYYNFKLNIYKDLITSNLINCIAERLTARVYYDENIGDLEILLRPLKKIDWDFHSNAFSIPFKCINYKNYEEAEFEDEKDPQDEELYFDAESIPNDCKFLDPHKVSFNDNISICISHYLNDLVLKVINLKRGNAEDIHIGGIDDENDGTVNFQINKLSINGIVYNFDKEINGTAFFSNVYDDL